MRLSVAAHRVPYDESMIVAAGSFLDVPLLPPYVAGCIQPSIHVCVLSWCGRTADHSLYHVEAIKSGLSLSGVFIVAPAVSMSLVAVLVVRV